MYRFGNLSGVATLHRLRCAMMNMCDDDLHFCNPEFLVILKCLSSGIQAAGLHYACAVLHQSLL